MEGIENEEITLLKTAALFHDAGFIVQYDDNEDFAIEMVKSMLPNFGYSQKQIEIIATIINSTKPNVKPTNILEEIMSDADYDYLGRSDYTVIANKLREEMTLYGYNFSEIEWVNYQLNFLENKHKFYTSTAQNIREIGKRNTINKLKLSLENLT